MESNNQVVRRLLLLSTAKKLVFILCFFSLCIGFGQSTYSYYVEISGNSPYTLGTLVPNPASSQVTVSYDATSATSAYLMITNTATGSSNIHILNTANTQATLSLSAYPNGIYTVTLVCNGAIVESKNLIKN
ncbi:MAG TPA: T9SS type A sorting domain-containing protein [Brumimicrobium sp.]|nr:T9SS type A sorting domain-containing protein [Brumimicrobium sp.]